MFPQNCHSRANGLNMRTNTRSGNGFIDTAAAAGQREGSMGPTGSQRPQRRTMADSPTFLSETADVVRDIFQICLRLLSLQKWQNFIILINKTDKSQQVQRKAFGEKMRNCFPIRE